MSAIAARGRGLATTVIPPGLLAEIDVARDGDALARALSRAGVIAPVERCDPETLDRIARDRVASDLAILGRWTAELDALVLDEDRRSVRAIVRGIAAGVSTERRLAATIPTPRLSARSLAMLAAAPDLGELVELLVYVQHPYATPVAAHQAPGHTLELEVALARCCFGLARTRDRALHRYLAQAIDGENTASALLLAARGGELERAPLFISGGELVDRDAFLAAAAGPLDVARDRLGAALAGTPLSRALYAPAAAAVEDALLAWQLATQARLRLHMPLGLAPALHAVLLRRDEARHLRRAAWRLRLGGGA